MNNLISGICSKIIWSLKTGHKMTSKAERWGHGDELFYLVFFGMCLKFSNIKTVYILAIGYKIYSHNKEF